MSTADERLQAQTRALADPTRHRLFRYLADGPAGVAELTEHVGLHHNAIRQHLAVLVDAGLVIGATAPASGRGRPRLQYVVAPDADSRWGVTGPYERLSVWLTEIVESGDSAFEVGRRVGREREAGLGSGDPVDAVALQMATDGFAPTVRRRGATIDITLTVCPFATTALAAPGVVCELHRGIATGVAESVGGIVVEALRVEDPRRAGCRLRCRTEGGRLVEVDA